MKPQRGKVKLSGRWKFLLLVLAVYGLTALALPELVMAALAGFGQMLGKIVPILAVVFVVLFLLNLFLKPESINKHLGADSGLKGWLFAVVGGILVMGPPFVLYPMLGELKKNGARDSLLAVFLYNRNVKIPFVPAMVYYFGFVYTVILSLYIILFSLLSGKLIGWLLEKHDKEEASSLPD